MPSTVSRSARLDAVDSAIPFGIVEHLSPRPPRAAGRVRYAHRSPPGFAAAAVLRTGFAALLLTRVCAVPALLRAHRPHGSTIAPAYAAALLHVDYVDDCDGA